MFGQRFLIASLVAISTLVGVGARAYAGECGSLSVDDSGGVVVVLGERYFKVGGFLAPSGVAAACVLQSDGTQTFHEFAGCTAGTSGARDWLSVYTDEGDDIIATSHPFDDVFECDWSGGGDGRGAYIGPWATTTRNATNFFFGVAARGMGGSDEIYGSPNRDYLFSSRYYGFSIPDDGEVDLLCGYDGDDYLYGDAGDSSDYECLDGGADADYCNGNGSGTDYGQNCETSVSLGSAWLAYCQPNPWFGGVSWTARRSGCLSSSPRMESWFTDCDGTSGRSSVCL